MTRSLNLILLYIVFFLLPRQNLPAILQNNFNYIIPDNIVVQPNNNIDDDDIGNNGTITNDDEQGFATADSATEDEQSPTLTDNESDESTGPSTTKIFKADSTYETSSSSSSSSNEKFDPNYRPSKSCKLPTLPPRATRSRGPSEPSLPSTSQPSSGMTASFFSGALSRVGNVVSRLVDSHPLANPAMPMSVPTPGPTLRSSAGSQTNPRTTTTGTRKRPLPSPSQWPKKG